MNTKSPAVQVSPNLRSCNNVILSWTDLEILYTDWTSHKIFLDSSCRKKLVEIQIKKFLI